MNFLEGVQALHREAKLPGAPPSSVATVAIGSRAADLVEWYREAHNAIQRDRDGKWKWLRRDFTFDTVADDQDYAYGSVTDVTTAAAITRFRSWFLDYREPPLCYLTADGISTQYPLTIISWEEYSLLYLRATHTASRPMHVVEGPDGQLYLGPKPDDVYTVTGKYWASNLVLAADDDEPEFHTDYHMAIVFRAMIDYGYNAVARELLARAGLMLPAIYNELVLNQAWSRFTLSTTGPLA